MDGRYEEVYYDREFENLMTFEQEFEGWEESLNSYPTDMLILDKTTPVYKTMEKHNNWVKIYEGDFQMSKNLRQPPAGKEVI